MKEAILIGSYSNTMEKEISLIKTILDWKKYNLPIILSTHYPESERVQNLVDYYVFDKKQYMEDKLTVNQYYGCESFRIDAPANRPYHAAAGMISLQNAIKAFGEKYDFIYLQDYDVQLNKAKVLEMMRNLYSSQFEMFMMNWRNMPEAYATNVCFFKKGMFNKIWGEIQSVDDYLDLVQSTPQKNIFIEHLAKNLIDLKNLQNLLYLFSKDQCNQIISNFSEHTADIVEPRIYMCSTTNGAILFLVNPQSGTLHFKVQTKNLINGNEAEQIYNLAGKVSMQWIYFENTYVKVTCNNIEKSYYVTPYNLFKECTFQFFDNTPIYIKTQL